MAETVVTSSSKTQWALVKSRRSSWLFPVITVVVIVVSAVLVLIPQIKAIKAGREELAVLNDQLTRLTAKHQFLAGLSEAELDSQLLTVSQALPNDKPISRVLGILGQRTTQNEVTLKGYSLNPGVVASGPAERAPVKTENTDLPGKLAQVPVEFDATGNFEQLVAMLTSFETTSPLSRVTALSLSGFENEKPQTLPTGLTAKLSMEVLYSPPPATIGKTSDPLPVMTAKQKEILQTLIAFRSAELEANPMPLGVDQMKANPFTY